MFKKILLKDIVVIEKKAYLWLFFLNPEIFIER